MKTRNNQRTVNPMVKIINSIKRRTTIAFASILFIVCCLSSTMLVPSNIKSIPSQAADHSGVSSGAAAPMEYNQHVTYDVDITTAWRAGTTSQAGSGDAITRYVSGNSIAGKYNKQTIYFSPTYSYYGFDNGGTGVYNTDGTAFTLGFNQYDKFRYYSSATAYTDYEGQSESLNKAYMKSNDDQMVEHWTGAPGQTVNVRKSMLWKLQPFLSGQPHDPNIHYDTKRWVSARFDHENRRFWTYAGGLYGMLYNYDFVFFGTSKLDTGAIWVNWQPTGRPSTTNTYALGYRSYVAAGSTGWRTRGADVSSELDSSGYFSEGLKYNTIPQHFNSKMPTTFSKYGLTQDQGLFYYEDSETNGWWGYLYDDVDYAFLTAGQVNSVNFDWKVSADIASAIPAGWQMDKVELVLDEFYRPDDIYLQQLNSAGTAEIGTKIVAEGDTPYTNINKVWELDFNEVNTNKKINLILKNTAFSNSGEIGVFNTASDGKDVDDLMAQVNSLKARITIKKTTPTTSNDYFNNGLMEVTRYGNTINIVKPSTITGISPAPTNMQLSKVELLTSGTRINFTPKNITDTYSSTLFTIGGSDYTRNTGTNVISFGSSMLTFINTRTNANPATSTNFDIKWAGEDNFNSTKYSYSYEKSTTLSQTSIPVDKLKGVSIGETIKLTATLGAGVVLSDLGNYQFSFWFENASFATSKYVHGTDPRDPEIVSGVITKYIVVDFSASGIYNAFMETKRLSSGAVHVAHLELHRDAVIIGQHAWTINNPIVVSAGTLSWTIAFNRFTTASTTADILVGSINVGSVSPRTVSTVFNQSGYYNITDITINNDILYLDDDYTFDFKIKKDGTTPTIDRMIITDFRICSTDDVNQYVLRKTTGFSELLINNAGYVSHPTITFKLNTGANIPLRESPYSIYMSMTFKNGATTVGSRQFNSMTATPTRSNSLILMGMPDFEEHFDTKGSMTDWQFFDNRSPGSLTATITEDSSIDLLVAVGIGGWSSILNTTEGKTISKAPSGLAYPEIEISVSNSEPSLYEKVTFTFSVTDPDNDLKDIWWFLGNSTYTIIPWTKNSTLWSNPKTIQVNLWNFNLRDGLFYDFKVGALDKNGHQRNASTSIQPRAQAAIITEILSPASSTTEIPIYQFIPIRVRIVDLDKDILNVTAPVTCKVKSLDGLTTFASIPMILESQSGTTFTYRNASVVRLVNYLTVANMDYKFHFEVVDGYGSNVDSEEFFEFFARTYIPTRFMQGSKFPADNTQFNEYQVPACEIWVYDGDVIQSGISQVYGDFFGPSYYAVAWISYLNDTIIGTKHTGSFSYQSGVFAWRFTYDGSGFNFGSLDYGNYVIHMEFKDAFGNIFDHKTPITKIETLPAITPLSPVANYTSINYLVPNTYDLSIQVFDAGGDIVENTVKCRLTNSTNSWNWQTMTKTSGSQTQGSPATLTFSKTFTFPAGLFDGDYTFEFEAYDTKSHVARVYVHVTLTSNVPTITINTPSQGATFGKNQLINLQILITDVDNDVIPSSVIARFAGIDFDSGNITMTPGSGGLYSASYTATGAKQNQTAVILVECRDSQNHFTGSMVSINIVVYYPQLSNPSPIGSTYASNTTIPIGIRITDPDSTTGQIVAKCRVTATIGSWTYDSGLLAMSWTGFTNWNTSLSSVPLEKNGLYVIVYQVHDENGDSGIYNITTTSFFTIQNNPPTVNITSPSDGAIFRYNQQIVIEATIYDVDGATNLRSQTFSIFNATNVLANNISMAKVTGNLYRGIYNPPAGSGATWIANGSYSIMVNATDKQSLSTVQYIEVFINNHAPVITSITPNTNLNFNYQNTTLFIVTVTDLDNDLRNVTLTTLENSVLIEHNMTFISGSWRYSFDFSNHTVNKTLAMIFKASDLHGNTVSQTLLANIYAYKPESITIFSPTLGQGFTLLETISISTKVVDRDADLTSVVYWFKNGAILTETLPLSYNGTHWIGSRNLALFGVGSWQLIVRATDNLGQTLTNSSVIISVTNFIPLVVIQTPLPFMELVQDFQIVANVTDLDNDLVSVIYQIGTYPSAPMALINGSYRANVSIYDYKYGTYQLKVTATDSGSNVKTETITIYLRPYEVKYVQESDIAYSNNNVVIDGITQTGIITITHDPVLQSLRLRVILPTEWNDVDVLYEKPVIIRGSQYYYPTNNLILNRTMFEFQFPSYASTDLLTIKFPKPRLVEVGIQGQPINETHYESRFELTSKRSYTNLQIKDKSLGFFIGTAVQFYLEIRTETGWVLAPESWNVQFIVGDAPKFSATIPSITSNETILFRIVRYSPQVEQPVWVVYWLPAMVAGLAAGGLGFLWWLGDRSGNPRFSIEGFGKKKFWLIIVAVGVGTFFALMLWLGSAFGYTSMALLASP